MDIDEEREEFRVSRTTYKNERAAAPNTEIRKASLPSTRSLPKLHHIKSNKKQASLHDFTGILRNKVVLEEVKKFEGGLKRVKDL
jgi:hypothetical protein